MAESAPGTSGRVLSSILLARRGLTDMPDILLVLCWSAIHGASTFEKVIAEFLFDAEVGPGLKSSLKKDDSVGARLPVLSCLVVVPEPAPSSSLPLLARLPPPLPPPASSALDARRLSCDSNEESELVSGSKSERASCRVRGGEGERLINGGGERGVLASRGELTPPLGGEYDRRDAAGGGLCGNECDEGGGGVEGMAGRNTRWRLGGRGRKEAGAKAGRTEVQGQGGRSD